MSRQRSLDDRISEAMRDIADQVEVAFDLENVAHIQPVAVRRRSTAPTLAVAALLLVVGGAVVAWVNRDRPERTATSVERPDGPAIDEPVASLHPLDEPARHLRADAEVYAWRGVRVEIGAPMRTFSEQNDLAADAICINVEPNLTGCVMPDGRTVASDTSPDGFAVGGDVRGVQLWSGTHDLLVLAGLPAGGDRAVISTPAGASTVAVIGDAAAAELGPGQRATVAVQGRDGGRVASLDFTAPETPGGAARATLSAAAQSAIDVCRAQIAVLPDIAERFPELSADVRRGEPVVLTLPTSGVRPSPPPTTTS